MTPKEKAKKLVEKFKKHANGFNKIGTYDGGRYRAKKCALIAVDEILSTALVPNEAYRLGKFWKEVKEEIKLL